MFKEVEPRATSTPSRARVDPYSSGDEYLFDTKLNTNESPFSLQPTITNAGATPHPKKRTSIAPFANRISSTLKKDLEEFGKKLEDEYCLFGSVHVKTAASIITIIDLLFIFQLDEYFYNKHPIKFNYELSLLLTIGLLLIVVIAQFAIKFKKSWMLLPLIMGHASFSITWLVFTITHDISMVYIDEISFGRLGMLLIRQLLLTMFNFYMIFILICAYINMGDSKRFIKMSIVNALFEKAMEDDVVLYDNKEKPEAPIDKAPRTVRFIEHEA